MCLADCSNKLGPMPTSARRVIAGFPTKKIRQAESGVLLMDMNHALFPGRQLASKGAIVLAGRKPDLWLADGLSFNSNGRVCLQVDWLNHENSRVQQCGRYEADNTLSLLEFAAQEYGIDRLFGEARQTIRKNGRIKALHAFVLMCRIEKTRSSVSLFFGARLEGVLRTGGNFIGPTSLGSSQCPIIFTLPDLTLRQYKKILSGSQYASLAFLPYAKPLACDATKLTELLQVFKDKEFAGKFVWKKDTQALAVCLGEQDQHIDIAKAISGAETKENVIGGHIKIIQSQGQVAITLFSLSEHFDEIAKDKFKSPAEKVVEFKQAADNLIGLVRAATKLTSEPVISSSNNDVTIKFNV